MDLSEYKEYLIENSLSEDILPVFDFFEPLTDDFLKIEKPFDNRNETTPYFAKVEEKLNSNLTRDTELSRAIKRLSQKTRNNIFGRSIYYSLYQNYFQFINMRNNGSVLYVRKWIKVLCSAYTATRFAVIINELERELKHKSKKINVILATGIVDDNDRIAASVKEEIDYIWGKSFHEKSALVVPFIGCSFYLFRRLMTSKYFTGLHIAGHGDNYFLKFLDDEKDYSEFVSCYVNDFEYSLLNCCCTYGFIGQHKIPRSKITIAHQETVDDPIAIGFTYDFYDMIWREKKDIISTANICIGNANKKEANPHKYFLLQ